MSKIVWIPVTVREPLGLPMWPLQGITIILYNLGLLINGILFTYGVEAPFKFQIAATAWIIIALAKIVFFIFSPISLYIVASILVSWFVGRTIYIALSGS